MNVKFYFCGHFSLSYAKLAIARESTANMTREHENPNLGASDPDGAIDEGLKLGDPEGIVIGLEAGIDEGGVDEGVDWEGVDWEGVDGEEEEGVDEKGVVPGSTGSTTVISPLMLAW